MLRQAGWAEYIPRGGRTSKLKVRPKISKKRSHLGTVIEIFLFKVSKRSLDFSAIFEYVSFCNFQFVTIISYSSG